MSFSLQMNRKTAGLLPPGAPRPGLVSPAALVQIKPGARTDRRDPSHPRSGRAPVLLRPRKPWHVNQETILNRSQTPRRLDEHLYPPRVLLRLRFLHRVP